MQKSKVRMVSEKFFFFKIFQKGSNRSSKRRNTKKENEEGSGQMRIHTKTQKIRYSKKDG